MRYGRLGRAERASFERHLLTCPSCLRDVRALESVAEIIRASSPGPKDDLQDRRERTRLLSAYDRELVAPTSRRRTWLVGSLAIAAIVAGVVVSWRVRREAPHVAIVLQEAAAVHAESTAAWSKKWQGNREEIVLEQGTLSIHVEHSLPKSSVLVRLPDGELEDIGTTFSVSVENSRTTGVAVEEGTVVLRLHGRPPVLLDHGAVWTPDMPPANGAAPTAAAISSVLPSSTPPPRPRSPVRSSATTSQASSDFRDAIALLDHGDNREADAALTRFLAKYRRDPRSEDAAYLRVIALQRCGDAPMMKEAARAYLRRYPSGLRRADLERLLGDTAE